MRKITSEVCRAFQNYESFRSGNDVVEYKDVFGVMVKEMSYRGNVIARKVTGQGLKITNAGWATTTTKERLNGLDDVSIVQKKGVWYLNGKVWGGEWVFVNNF